MVNPSKDTVAKKRALDLCREISKPKELRKHRRMATVTATLTEDLQIIAPDDGSWVKMAAGAFHEQGLLLKTPRDYP